MYSPGQKRGSCGHAMAIFDGHAFCARCREKGKGEEPCVKDKDSVDCVILSPRNNVPKSQHPLTKSKRKNGRQNVLKVPKPQKSL